MGFYYLHIVRPLLRTISRDRQNKGAANAPFSLSGHKTDRNDNLAQNGKVLKGYAQKSADPSLRTLFQTTPSFERQTRFGHTHLNQKW